MQLHEELKRQRKAHRYTLADVSEKTELSVSFLSDIERGRTNPSLDTLQKLAQCYEVPVSHFFGELSAEQSSPSRPPSLEEFLSEVHVDEEMLDLLLRVERRAASRARGKEDWKKYYYSLQGLLGR